MAEQSNRHRNTDLTSDESLNQRLISAARLAPFRGPWLIRDFSFPSNASSRNSIFANLSAGRTPSFAPASETASRNKGPQRILCIGDPARRSDRCRMTPVQTRFTNMYEGEFTIGGIVPWVSPPDIRIGDWDVIVDPSAIADRTKRKASQRAATGALARIDAPAATAENRRTRKVRRVARRAGASQRAMVFARRWRAGETLSNRI
jgi:hypothetical protein